MAPLVSRVLAKVPTQQAGVAAGVLSTMQSAGNAIGVALIAFVFFVAGSDGRFGAGGHTGFVASMLCLCLVSAVLGVLSHRLCR